MTMKAIAHYEAPSTVASITFMSVGDIPSEYTDLLIVVSARSTGTEAGGGAILLIRPNGSTSSMSSRHIGASGSGVYTGTDTTIYTRMTPGDLTANTFGINSIYIGDYRSSYPKRFSVDGAFENDATFARLELLAGLWNSSSPITSIQLLPSSGSFAQYTKATLYGITAGSDGTTTVS